ncbi:MAG TPA: glycerophosphodiester phosphodiesterase family protein, partial [bacterium]|nr:glycerophosphodiester phosphodiesterase family protein [bacterium]
MTRPRLLGHRGARAHSPENTLTSLRHALRSGADGFEFDVRATADGHAVLMHDETVDRTTDGAGPLASLTLERVRELNAGSWFDATIDDEPVPTLDEVMDEFLGSTALALEMKEVLPDSVLRTLAWRLAGASAAKALEDDRLVLASFRSEAVDRARELVPAAPRARILRREEPIPGSEERAGLELWGVFARWESVDARFLE